MRVPIWKRYADLLAFSLAQATGAVAVLRPKLLWLMVGAWMMCRAASLWLRPWKNED